MWQFLFLCQWTPRLHEHYLFENKRLKTGLYGWDKKKLPILWVVSSTRTIFCMWQFFICHIETNTPTEIGQFCLSTRANKNCHIKIARIDGALECQLKIIIFFSFSQPIFLFSKLSHTKFCSTDTFADECKWNLLKACVATDFACGFPQSNYKINNNKKTITLTIILNLTT